MQHIFTDQLGRKVNLFSPPQRIVSVVPSQTELLFDLGLGDRVVGITKFCVHPREWFNTKARVGGTKTLHFEKIAALKPDLIIGNKEENEQTQIEALMSEYPVWMSDISTLAEALSMIRSLGAITAEIEKANALALEIESRFKEPPLPPLRTAYLIWRKPYMAAGGGTFIDHMMSRAGFVNIFSNIPRYPEILPETLVAGNPEVILLSSEPYPFSAGHVEEIKGFCSKARVVLVDGEIFSWYGSRLLHAPAYFESLEKDVLPT